MPGERYRHILLPGPSRTQPFTSPRQGGDARQVLDRDRAAHGAYLRQRLDAAWQENDQRQAVAHATRNGVYIDFVGEPGFDLAIRSLERISSGIRLLNVRREGLSGQARTLATVFVPNSRRRFFLNKVRAYVEKDDQRSGAPKNANLVNSVSDIRCSVLQSFWIDDPDLLPGATPAWVELWLSASDDEVLQRFNALLREMQVERAEGVLKFPERSVILIHATRPILERLIEMSDDVAELRLAKEVATVLVAMENRDQAKKVQELLARTRFRNEHDVAVTILDTGVNSGHALIQPVLADADRHAVNPAWGVGDDADPRWAHGTLMAGVATYGDLLGALTTNGRVAVAHRLESAKILPPSPATTHKKLWGYMTAQGLALAEIQAPARRRVACLAVTSTDDRDRGRPSSWSAMVDELASGAQDGTRRLFVVSAGNIYDQKEFRNYPTSNQTNEVHDPGQSWNALTVGAFTERTRIADPTLRSFTAIAPPGGLSPFSTTSTTWSRR